MTDPLTGLNGEPDEPARARPRKSAEAYRTISEVADELHVPQHVLRFWETKFPRIKPLKRGGGRRYYRPDDVVLLRRIADLLYIQGYTIKGVQRLLKEGGGALHDEIPPASEEERAAAVAERAQAGGIAPGKSRARDDLPELPIAPTAGADRQDVSVQAVPSPGDDRAARRLRETMRLVLAELERLRASLSE